jgi:DNA (cytosine-5)-methyltransferase 1
MEKIGWTFCSGIGAPEMAAPWVDWRLASEIEPFPRAVLADRFGYRVPEDHNQGDPLLWGDFTEINPEMARARGVPLPDLIVAGTPCQAFSIAGLRNGVADERGNLTLKFVETCHAIVNARPDGKLAVLWENVPGVLSDKNNAFGCFLGGLVGAVDAIIPEPKPEKGKSSSFWTWKKRRTVEIVDCDGEPTGKFRIIEAHHALRWPREGMVQGPRARAAWSVLDARWFGVAQRRRRVFVVVDFGECVDPAAVLLEPDRLRGDHPPRVQAGQGIAGTLSARTEGGGGLGTDFDLAGGLQPVAAVASTGDVSHCLNAGGMGRQDYETETLVAHALRGEGFDASEGGTGRGTPIVPVCFGSKDHGADAMFDLAPTLRAGGHSGSHANAGIPPTIAFPAELSGTQVASSAEVSPSLSVKHTMAVAWQDRTRGDDGRGYDRPPAISEEVCGTLETVKPWTVAIQERACAENPDHGPGGSEDGVAYTLEARHHVQAVANQWAVRRLIPVECARLQGFPDDHTAITYRGQPAADGPQYKAYGNSMAVPVVRWILDRVRISAGWV